MRCRQVARAQTDIGSRVGQLLFNGLLLVSAQAIAFGSGWHDLHQANGSLGRSRIGIETRFCRHDGLEQGGLDGKFPARRFQERLEFLQVGMSGQVAQQLTSFGADYLCGRRLYCIAAREQLIAGVDFLGGKMRHAVLIDVTINIGLGARRNEAEGKPDKKTEDLHSLATCVVIAFEPRRSCSC